MPKLIPLFMFILLLASCSNFNSSSEYYKYIRNNTNGLKKTISKEEIIIEATYIPTELRLLKNNDYLKLSKQNILDEMEKLSMSIEFSFSIAPTQKCRVKDLNYFDVSGEKEYGERQNFLNFNFSSSFQLEIKGVTFYPKLCHFVKDNGISCKYVFLLVFVPNTENQFPLFKDRNNTIELIFQDPLFETGRSLFRINSQSINSIPELKL